MPKMQELYLALCVHVYCVYCNNVSQGTCHLFADFVGLCLGFVCALITGNSGYHETKLYACMDWCDEIEFESICGLQPLMYHCMCMLRMSSKLYL